MKNPSNRNTPFKFSNVLVVATIFIVLVCFSCKEEPSATQNTEGDLITKINAVQEQIMAQGNITEEEEQALSSLCSIIAQDDGMAIYTSDNSVILKDVEIAPVYDGCEELSAAATRSCFKDKITTFIEREFNLSISKELNLSATKEVDAFFIIDENGSVTGLKVRDSEVTVQAEILRVLRKIPVMKPAMQNGAPVSVLCSMVVSYGDRIEVDVVYIPERPE